MNINIIRILSVFTVIILMIACGGRQENSEGGEHGHEEAEGHSEHEEEGEAVHFSPEQFKALDMQVDTLPLRNLSSVVQANGQLEVPPQNEATVTAIIGANVSSIKVIEGEEVKKGQVLAYLMHPNLTRLQGDYLEAYNNLQFVEQDYQRQKKLYEEEVGSGKTFQQTQAEYRSTQGMVKSFEYQLRQLGMNPVRIMEGNFYDQVPVVSPIDGSIVSVKIKIGQYVQPEKDLFEIINTHHIHADLMVFEKDVYKVKEGQRVRFMVEILPERELLAEIYSVGKKFEQDPKAVHVHAEIENLTGSLIPGMYIKGEILTDSAEIHALPEGAITREGDRYFAFLAEKELAGENENWMFTPIEVVTGNSNNGWVAVKFLQKIPDGSLFAMNNAYYLIAEMNKSEAGHSH
ncbi:MAG: efflux RND transporter periplasmic adaptor subunit [Anditalea sp.]